MSYRRLLCVLLIAPLTAWPCPPPNDPVGYVPPPPPSAEERARRDEAARVDTVRSADRIFEATIKREEPIDNFNHMLHLRATHALRGRAQRRVAYFSSDCGSQVPSTWPDDRLMFFFKGERLLEVYLSESEQAARTRLQLRGGNPAH